MSYALFMGMAGKNITGNRKKVRRKCRKQKNFVWTKADGYTALFVNAERGQRYGQTLH